MQALSVANSLGGELASPSLEELDFLCGVEDICCTSSD